MQKYFELTVRAWKLLKPFHGKFYLQLGVTFIVSGVSVLITFLGSQVLNFIVGKDLRQIIIFISLLVVVGIINVGLNFLQNYNEEKYLGQNIVQHLQELSLSKILSLTPEQHIEDHSAIKQQIIARGENSVEQVIKIYGSQFVPNISYFILALATLFYHSYILGFLSLASAVVLVIWINHFQKFSTPLIKENRDNWTLQGKIRTEVFTHLQLVKLLNREDFFIKKYINGRKKYADFDTDLSLTIVKHRQKKNLFWEIVEQGSLAVAAILALTGYFSIGSVYLIWSILSRAFWSVSSLSNSVRDLPLRYVEAEKYFDAIDLEPSFDESGMKSIKMGEDIIFSNALFKYPRGDTHVLNNISFAVPAGKKTAFVGSSGSGKSTVVKLLLRAYDYTGGSIKIGGSELRKIDAGYIRERIGYVEQHVDLLDDTIRENILIAVKEKDRKKAEKRLEEVAKHSRITEFYHRLGDKKFDTIVGERGIKLSGGERQRVGIARAIIKDPDILIFDEATSSLDTENEAKVMEAINDVSKGKTTIIIAHRLSTVRDADKIIVMDKGSVVGEGTHDELLASNATYQNLVAHQLN